MPNWCSNSGSLTGDPETIKIVWEAVKDDNHGLTQVFVPCPEDLQKTVSGFLSEQSEGYSEWKAQQESNMEKYGYTDWYGWSVDNWGTKWSPEFEFSLSDDGTEISYHGDSAWSPPTQLFLTLSKMFPSLTITMSYTEEGNAFVGSSIFHNGVFYDSCGDCDVEYPDGDDPDYDAYFDAIDALKTEHELLVHGKFANGQATPESDLITHNEIEMMVKFALGQKVGGES